MDTDLNIDNYSFDDMLKLFNMPHNYDEIDLKKSLKILSRLHPDKCDLPDVVFMFFHKVYKILLNFHKIKKKDMFREDYCDESEKELLKNFSKKKNFNKHFNELFEKNANINYNDGYGDWLKTNNTQYEQTNNVNEYFNKKHNEIVSSNTIKELGSNTGGSNLYDDVSSYQSGIFGKLNYDDVKTVYSETHIPVSNNIGKTFSSVDELKQFRGKTIEKPLDKKEALRIIDEKHKQENNENMQQMFKLFKDDEEHQKNKNKWWTNFKKLTL